MTVAELRRSGYKVRVIHIRNDNPAHYYMNADPSPYHPKGGETVVEITTPDKNNLIGVAVCHPRDNYNKKMGVKIAVGRALTGSFNLADYSEAS